MTFQGRPEQALTFFSGLEKDNSRSYWTTHKAIYDAAVRGPMDELLASLADEFGPSRMFRPYRDLRFARDKSPYKTNIAAMFERGGYLELSAHGLSVAQGFHEMTSDQLDRYRRAVDRNLTGIDLVAILATPNRGGIETRPGDELKTTPRGYPKDHPRANLLRYKGLISWSHWPPGSWLQTCEARARVLEALHASGPLAEWLSTNVGTSESP
jgi:uncharacterized protein (TIGR02453 family)